MDSLLVAIGSIIATVETTSVACDRVLMCLDTAVMLVTILPKVNLIRSNVFGIAIVFPTKRKVRGRDNLDEVHEIVGWITRDLLGIIQRIQMVIGPWVGLGGQDYIVWYLRPEA